MTKDLLTRLRGTYCCDGINTCNCDESADEIERLRAALEYEQRFLALEQEERAARGAEIERLRAALREKDNIAYVIDSHGISHDTFTIVYRAALLQEVTHD